MFRELTEAKRIMIRIPNWIGDVVMSLPALDSLITSLTPREFFVVGRPHTLEIVLEGRPGLKPVPYPSQGSIRDIFYKATLISSLRRLNIRVAILFQNAFDAAMISLLAGIPYRMGFDTDSRSFLLTHPVTLTPSTLELHHVDYYLTLIRELGIEALSQTPTLHLDEKTINLGKEILNLVGIKKGSLVFAIAPGAAYGPAKTWPLENFREISTWLNTELGAHVIVLGGPMETELGRAISEGSKMILNLCGKTSLKEVMGLLSLCRGLICNDSGLMHLAAGIMVPLVAIFVSTDPAKTGPLSPAKRVLTAEISCSPCFRKTCTHGTYQCQKEITTGMVKAALLELLEETHEKEGHISRQRWDH